MKMLSMSRFRKIGLVLLFINSCLTFSLFAQSAINHPLGEVPAQDDNVIAYKGSRNYKFTERSDLRVYQNNKYLGLQTKIVTAFIIPSRTEKGLVYEGSFFIDQDTNRNKAQVGYGLHEAIPSSFIINGDGNLTMLVDNGYPSFRSFPAYSSQKLKKGDVWQAKAMRAVDPLSKGVVTKMPIYVQYTYTGDDYYNGEPVYLITAQWATRYGTGATTLYVDWGGDKELQTAMRSHKATIIVSKKTGAALVIRDTVDETFIYTDGNKYQYKGTISLFTEYPTAVDRSKLIAALKTLANLNDEEAKALENRIDDDALYGKKDDSENNGYADDSWEPVNTSEWVTEKNPQKSDNQKVDSQKSDKKADTKKSAKTEKLKQQIENSKPKEDAPVLVDNTEAGIRLTMQNLQFKADSAELLPGEDKRLEQIAELLKLADGAQFLIEGHTASTGYEAGEMKLSKERADSVAKALAAHGISSERFICKGSGGKKPVASNDTPEGKAKNRRVEITILD